jgi:phosphoribosyl 1,2-cyclic phosphodiesterase
MALTFCSLSSGSSGNCYYVGNEFYGIIIDAGISATSIRKFLAGMNISMQTVMGVFITHNHSDHIKGLEVLLRKNHLPAFTTKAIWKSILSERVKISTDCIREIPLQQKLNIAGFDILAFPVSHDAPETVGFHISSENKNITIATDLGHINEPAASYIRQSNVLVIESNYDEEMLATGAYPYYLKARISSNNGHLGNRQASGFVADILNDNISHICLAHLSKNNNTPDRALQTFHKAISSQRKELKSHQTVCVLNRHSPSDIIRM